MNYREGSMEKKTPIKVFLADDHPLFRSGLKYSLGMKKDFVILGEASDGYSAVEKIKEDKPDIVLIDLDMPGLSGIAAIRIVKKMMPDLIMLILSTYSEEKHVREAMNAGADGYLLKNIPLEELQAVIYQFINGDSCFSPYLLNISLEQIPVVDTVKLEDFGLTSREREVLHNLAQGTSNKEISNKLFISVETVKSHIKNIYKKLEVKNRVEAMKVYSDKLQPD
jgi:DNA-binding NarL/FixJ family response regulator